MGQAVKSSKDKMFEHTYALKKTVYKLSIILFKFPEEIYFALKSNLVVRQVPSAHPRGNY